MDSPTSNKLLSQVASLSLNATPPRKQKRAIALSSHTPFPSPAVSQASKIPRQKNVISVGELETLQKKLCLETQKLVQLKTRDSYLKKFSSDCHEVLEYLDKHANIDKGYSNSYHHFESDFVHYLQFAVLDLYNSQEFADNLLELLQLTLNEIFVDPDKDKKTPAGAVALSGSVSLIPKKKLHPHLFSLEDAAPWMRVQLIEEAPPFNSENAKSFVASSIEIDDSNTKTFSSLSTLKKFVENQDYKTAISGYFFLLNYFSGLLEIDSAAHYPALSRCIQLLLYDALDLVFSGDIEDVYKLEILLGELMRIEPLKTQPLSDWLKEFTQLETKLVDLDFKYAEATKEKLCLVLDRGKDVVASDPELLALLQKIGESLCCTVKKVAQAKCSEVEIAAEWQQTLRRVIDSNLQQSKRDDNIWIEVMPILLNMVNGCALPP